MVERIYSEQVKDITVLLEAELQEGYRLAFDQALAVKTKDRWWVASQDLSADRLDNFSCFDNSVIFRDVSAKMRGLLGVLGHKWSSVDSHHRLQAWLKSGGCGTWLRLMKWWRLGRQRLTSRGCRCQIWLLLHFANSLSSIIAC